MRAWGAALIVLGLAVLALWIMIYGVFDAGKNLAKRETRPEAVEGIKEGAKTTGVVVGGTLLYFILFFGGIFLLLFVIYGLGLG